MQKMQKKHIEKRLIMTVHQDKHEQQLEKLNALLSDFEKTEMGTKYVAVDCAFAKTFKHILCVTES